MTLERERERERDRNMSDDRFMTRWWNYCRSSSKSEHKGGTLSLWNSGHKVEQNSLLQRWWWRKEEAAEQGKIHSLWSSISGKSKHVPVTEATAFTIGGIIMPKALLCEYYYVWICSCCTWLTRCHDKSKILLLMSDTEFWSEPSFSSSVFCAFCTNIW